MSTITNTSLLLGLEARDNPAWSQFYARYQPMLVSFGRRLGLGELDAQDAAQETLLAFADGYRKGRYDREKGRLRTWLFGIATNKIRDALRRRGREMVVDVPDKTQLMANLPDEDRIGQVWESEWQRALMDACLEEVSKHVETTTIQAFELFVLREWPADKVASQLGISRNAVFKAKRRVLTRMRSAHDHLETSW